MKKGDKQKTEKKALKEALKSETSPLLISLKNQVKDTNDKLDKLIAKETPIHDFNIRVNKKGVAMIKGKDGYTPVRGKDYFTDADIKHIVSLSTPQLGKDYFTSSDKATIIKLVTPKKNVDYFDGKTPIFGVDFWTKAEQDKLSSYILERATPIKGIHYKDGKNGITTIKTVTEKITPEEIRDKLESLKSSARLSVNSIKGIEEFVKSLMNNNTPIRVGGIGGSGTVSSDGKFKVSVTDASAGYLSDKEVFDSSLTSTITNPSGNAVRTTGINPAYSNTFTVNQFISNANFTVSEGTISVGNVTSGSATQVNDPSGVFSDNGNTFVWSVYAIKDGVKSATPYIITQSDSNTSSQSFYWHLTWGAVAGADSYLIVVDQDDYNGYYGDFYMETTAPTVTWDYNGTSGDGTIGTPPSYFTSPYITNGIGDFYNVLADKGTIGTLNATTVTASGAIAGGTSGTFGTSVTTPILNVSTLNKSGGSYIDGSSGDVYFKGMGIGGAPGTVNNSLLYMKGSNNGTDHLPLWVFYGDGTAISTLFTTFSNGTASSAFQLTKARGTIASPLAAQNGDDIGSFRFNIQTGASSSGQSAAFGATVLDVTNVYSSMYFGVKDPAGQPTLASNTRFLLEYTASDGPALRPNNNNTLNFGTLNKKWLRGFFNGINLSAGTATAGTAPIYLTSGVSLTVAVAGAVEYTTDDLFFTISTGTARKRLLMADPTGGLTSGRVPHVTTNGRLTDSGSFLYAVGTGVTLTDENFILGTTTGSKIGTSTSQKLAFWNATPIVQPTTSVGSATLTSPGAGSNIKSDDTFDGYTLQQVVKALRNAGLLA